MSHKREIALLLDQAIAEAKQREHAVVQPRHLLAALRSTDPEAFAHQMGPDGSAALDQVLLPRGKHMGSPSAGAAAEKLLAEADEKGVDSLWALLHDVGSLAASADSENESNDGSSRPSDGPVTDNHDRAESPSTPASGPDGAAAPKERFDPDAARAHLQQAVTAQDHAIEAIVKRLVLTRADLDLRPDRPDGVFLFAGPTGVGKTEMAKALGGALFPDGPGVIRLDMSEYQDGVMAVAKLIGSGPGFVGHNEPANWLTTRVIANPNSVILLDEIEKAHPDVWTVFLQVFDDGRLTDGRGKTADFSNSVVIMTSNIGARLFESRSLGFKSNDGGRVDPRDGVVHEIRKTMPPELFNRIDETIVFRALDESDIRAVAERHIGQAVDRLRARGYDLELADGVVEFISTEGFDPDLGARHLLRNVERLLLAEAAARGPGSYLVLADPGAAALRWETKVA